MSKEMFVCKLTSINDVTFNGFYREQNETVDNTPLLVIMNH